MLTILLQLLECWGISCPIDEYASLGLVESPTELSHAVFSGSWKWP